MLKAIDNLTRRRSSRTNSNDSDTHLCQTCLNLNIRSLLDPSPSPKTLIRRGSTLASSLSYPDIKSQKKYCNLCSLLCDGAEAVLESNADHYVDKKISTLRIRPHAKHQLKLWTSRAARAMSIPESPFPWTSTCKNCRQV
jgi:hypothetical protein